MKTTWILCCLAFVGAMGCDDTAKGAEQDLRENSVKAGETSRDLGAVAGLTPAIKAAIVAEPTLNESGNLIDVDSTEEKVTLSGHVKTSEMKSRAEELAKRIIGEKNGAQSVENRLEVKPDM